MKRSVLFDLDGTLHDRAAGLRAFVVEQHQRLRLEKRDIPLERWRDRFVALDDHGHVWKDRVYARLVREFGLPFSAEALLDEYVIGFARHVVASPGLLPLFTELRAAGWRLGVVTNGRNAFQRATIAALGLEPLLDGIVVSELCGMRKPDPAIFRFALNQIGADAEESWFVGDDPVADMAGARSAGMQALLFSPEAASLPVHGIRRISELPNRLFPPH